MQWIELDADLNNECRRVKPTILAEGLGAMAKRVEPDAALPRLSRFIQLSEHRQTDAYPLESLLWSLLGQEGEVPVAMLSRLADKPSDCGGNWLRADPVWLRADINRVYLAATQQIQLTPDEVVAIRDALQPWLSELELQFDAELSDRWYVRVTSPAQAFLPNPTHVMGYDLASVFERLNSENTDEAGHWQRLMNEMQMLLFQHPVNERRRQQGRPEANSLWFWGGGVLPDNLSHEYQFVQHQHVLFQGLLAWQSELEKQQVENHQYDSTEAITQTSSQAVPMWHWCPQTGESPQQALSRLESIVAAAMAHSDEVRLFSDEGHYWLLSGRKWTRKLLDWRPWDWRPWRRTRPLSDWFT